MLSKLFGQTPVKGAEEAEGAEQEVQDMDYMYLSGEAEPETQVYEDGIEGQQDDPVALLQSRVGELETDFAKASQQNSDKDRHIGQLERELNVYTRMNSQIGDQAASEPAPADTPPAFVLSEEDRAVLAQTHEEDPAKALILMGELAARKAQEKAETLNRESTENSQRQEQVRALYDNINHQLDTAVDRFGPQAEQIKRDFRDHGTNSWVAKLVASDQSLLLSPTGVVDRIELEMRRAYDEVVNEQEDYVPQDAPKASTPAGMLRPSAGRTPINTPAKKDQRSVEDKIGDAIVASATGDDAIATNLLRGV